MFGNLTTDGLQESQDRLGGIQVFNTDIYIGTIKALYAGKSSGGATSVTLIADLNGKEYTETLYVTNKDGQNWFANKQDNTKKVPLPGFTVVDDICLIATGEPLAAQETEEKVIKIWDNEAKKEMPKSVPMIIAALGKPIALGIQKTLANKQTKVGNDYVPNAETREENHIDKVYHPEMKLTVAEARAGQDVAQFWDAWLLKNKDQVRDKRTIKDGEVGAPSKSAPTAAQSSDQPKRKSLFGNK